MSTQIQRRRGTTAEHSTFTGVEGELTVDTTKDTAVVHDGTTVGGHPLQKQYPPLGSAAAPTYTFTGDTNTGIYSPGADQVAVATGGAQRITVDASGRLLVGTSSAINANYTGGSIQLRDNAGGTVVFKRNDGVSSNGLGILEFHSSFGRAALIEVANDGTHTGASTPGAITFQTTSPGTFNSPTERLRITSAGLVGIGTSAPNTKLEIRGDSAGSVVELVKLNNNAVIGSGKGVRLGFGLSDSPTASSRAYIEAVLDGSNKTYLAFATNNGSGVFERARLDGDGRLLVGTSSSYTGYNFQVEGTAYSSSGGTFKHNANSAATGAVIKLIKSRGTSVGSSTIVQNDDRCGNIIFAGTDGSGDVTAASIEGFVDGTPGANDMPGRLVFSTTADGASSPTERMRIDSSGRVGIGTASPISRLNTLGTQGNWRIDPDSVSGEVQSYITNVANTNFIDYRIRTNQTIFNTGGSERARIDASGRLLVGTSTASNDFDGNAITPQIQLEGTSTNTASTSSVRNSADSSGPSFRLAKSRSATVGGRTIVQSGDVLGEIAFEGANGTDFIQSASIKAELDGTPGAIDMPGRLVFSTTADGASSPTERMRIRANGLINTFSNSDGMGVGIAGTTNNLFYCVNSATRSKPLKAWLPLTTSQLMNSNINSLP
jgi:hypothetical protein